MIDLSCPMCGASASTLNTRMWSYDNGERFAAAVCNKCAELHSKLIKGENK
jgi:hypothetical protein